MNTSSVDHGHVNVQMSICIVKVHIQFLNTIKDGLPHMLHWMSRFYLHFSFLQSPETQNPHKSQITY